MSNDAYTDVVKPILKWAGGKTQLLDRLMPKVPGVYGKYIEPFFGGGALYFALQPDRAVIADSNPELMNLYREVADNVGGVIECLQKYRNTKEMFYQVRSQDWELLPKTEAAARMIYLNRTCFNGLYRVNKKGQFNSSYGNYKNPTICNADALMAASSVLKRACIVCDDYISVLTKYAEPGDFIYLDPPYVPVSEYSDFKRYTKEQFYEDDHIRLAGVVKDLCEKGCYVLLTNSNSPLVHNLYGQYNLQLVTSKRNISVKGNSRVGEDLIITTY